MFVEPAAATHPAVVAARAGGVTVRGVVDGALAKILDVASPQHVVSIAVPRPTTLAPVVADAAGRGRPVVVLVALQDPGNVGTLVRVAEAAGCAGVVLTEHSVDVHNPKAVRASAGAVFRVPVVEGLATAVVLDACVAGGVVPWATVRDGGTLLDDATLGGACALVVGSEAHGLSEDVLARVDRRLSIPMHGSVESLNAGVAGALVAFEAARQRRATRRGVGQAAALGHNVGGPAPEAVGGPAPEAVGGPAPEAVGGPAPDLTNITTDEP